MLFIGQILLWICTVKEIDDIGHNLAGRGNWNDKEHGNN